MEKWLNKREWHLFRGIIYHYFTISLHRKYGLMREVALVVVTIKRGIIKCKTIFPVLSSFGLILAILFRLFGCIAPETLNYLAFQSLAL
jgi:hypothetical protein